MSVISVFPRFAEQPTYRSVWHREEARRPVGDSHVLPAWKVLEALRRRPTIALTQGRVVVTVVCCRLTR